MPRKDSRDKKGVLSVGGELRKHKIGFVVREGVPLRKIKKLIKEIDAWPEITYVEQICKDMSIDDQGKSDIRWFRYYIVYIKNKKQINRTRIALGYLPEIKLVYIPLAKCL